MSMRNLLILPWDGTEYKLTVTFEVIDRLEDHLNLGLMVARCSQGDIRFTHVAKLASLLLQEAGANVSRDEILEEIYSSGTDYEAKKLAGKILRPIFAAIFPEPKKKPKSTSTKKKVTKKSRNTRGKNSSKS